MGKEVCSDCVRDFDDTHDPSCAYKGVVRHEQCVIREEDKPEEGPYQPVLYQTLITPECFPKPGADGSAWVQQQTVLCHQLLELLSNMHQLILAEAPMLLERSMVGMFLATIGNVHQNLERLGFEWMVAHEVEPLSLHAEAVRVAKAQIEADPDMPEEVRASLEALIAEPEVELAPAEEGEVEPLLFVKGDSEQVH